MRRGTRRAGCGLAVDTRTVAWKCHGTTVPARGDWPTATFQVSFALPGPLVTKYNASARITAYTWARLSPTRLGMWRRA